MTPPKNTGRLIAPEYIAELRRRIEAGPGVVAVAKQAGYVRTTVWRMLTGGGDRPKMITVDAVERIRAALAALEPDAAPMPPPLVGVRSADHHAWIEMADALTPEELAAVVRQKRTALAALRSAVPTTPKRRR